MPIVILIIVIVALLAFAWISISNGIVRAANKCDNAWQTIETQLQRRNDLIPNLVETVKGYAAHESGTLEAVTAARGGHGLERAGLVGRVALDGLDEVGDEVVAALKLRLDGLPGVVALVCGANDAVADGNPGEGEKSDDDDDQNHDGHGVLLNPGGQKMAEEEGFEPSVRGYRTTVFKTAAFNHSATPPWKQALLSYPM